MPVPAHKLIRRIGKVGSVHRNRKIRENTNQVFLPVRIYGEIVCNHNNLNIMKKQADIFIYK
ncbi:hypothetical protein DW085_05895 [Clostridium sp. AF50-3]|nr:hypothetical protein DW085_05895 [Clostridium sp. AF50-3]